MRNKVAISDIGNALHYIIAPFEGCVLKPYLCPAGKPSIGYGSTYYEDGSHVTMIDKPITQDEADHLLGWHVHTQVVPIIETIIPQLEDYQNIALLSFVYNVGSENFKNSTLLKLINKDPLDPEIGLNFKKWNKARINGTLKEVEGLTKRRNWEWVIYSKKVPIIGSLDAYL